MAATQPPPDYYAELGVGATSNEEEIRKAFRKLAKLYHPDRNHGREAEFKSKFQAIQTAHEVLTDPQARIRHDNDLRKWRTASTPTYTPNSTRTRPPSASRNTYNTNPRGTYYRPPPPSPRRPGPPPHSSTFTTGADRFTNANFRAPPTAKRPDARPKDSQARADVLSAWQKMKAQHRDDTQANNNPNGAPFGRSQSTRTPPKKGFDPATPGGDERQARSSYRANYERPMPSPPQVPDPAKNSKDQDVPYAEGNRVRTPYYSHVGERTSMFNEGLGRSASVRNSPTRPTPSENEGSYSDSGRRPHRSSYPGKNTNPFKAMYASSDDSSNSEDLGASTNHNMPPPKSAPGQEQKGPSAPWGATPRNATTPNPFKSRSEESINTKFSPSDWHGKFEGKPDYFAPNLQKGAQGRASPVRGRPAQRTTSDRNPFLNQSQPPPQPSPFAAPYVNIPPPPPGPPPAMNPRQAAPETSTTKEDFTRFTQDRWQETFKEPSWVFSTRPKDASASSKRPPKASFTRKPSATPNETPIAERAEDIRPKYQAYAEAVPNENGDKMDIDSNTPPVEQPKKPATTGANAMPPPSQNSKRKEVPKGFDLKDLGDNLQTSASGRGDDYILVDDLHDALPFESKPSRNHPTKSSKPHELSLPPVPAPPTLALPLTKQSGAEYLKRMDTYIVEYRNFTKTMLAHFSGRQSELDTYMDDGCFSKVGEPTKKIGSVGYTRRAKEDEKLLQAWNVAQEMHVKALNECADIRIKVEKLPRMQGVRFRISIRKPEGGTSVLETKSESALDSLLYAVNNGDFHPKKAG